MRKLNPLKEKVLEVSNDTFWYLTQKQEIKFTAKGRGYFFMHGRKEYIDTFMRK